jgi:hypothetical protein
MILLGLLLVKRRRRGCSDFDHPKTLMGLHQHVNEKASVSVV